MVWSVVQELWDTAETDRMCLTKHSLDQLNALVKARLKRMLYRPRLIKGLITETRLDFQPPSAVKDL